MRDLPLKRNISMPKIVPPQPIHRARPRPMWTTVEAILHPQKFFINSHKTTLPAGTSVSAGIVLQPRFGRRRVEVKFGEQFGWMWLDELSALPPAAAEIEEA